MKSVATVDFRMAFGLVARNSECALSQLALSAPGWRQGEAQNSPGYSFWGMSLRVPGRPSPSYSPDWILWTETPRKAPVNEARPWKSRHLLQVPRTVRFALHLQGAQLLIPMLYCVSETSII